ncbi:TetR/AcrR family transcriptional regulator [Bacillus sp. FJAT-47783]|uniref:TetR/AcrR family transcriptional regulator n=1 Tax=Bacillus sp. FJAT-47783 TaxID=2922712 RepID=UPI001FABC5BA|nr:TetR/AcrR family transcriptional regulator [Bacillus sp. FJAT-47783]
MSPRKGLDIHDIIQAAAEIADEHGIEQLSMALLAKRLDIRSPSLYNHVAGLDDVKIKLAVYGLRELHCRMAKASNGKSGDEAIHALSDAYLTFTRNRPGLYQATFLMPDTQTEEVKNAGEEMVELVAQVLRNYDLEGEQVIHAVRGLRSILHGFASLEFKGGFGLPLDVEKSLTFVIDTFLAGIDKMK